MKVAITEWKGRVAPLFDVSGTVLVVESTPDGHSPTALRVCLPLDGPHSKISTLKDLQVDTLICGAISRPVRESIEARGIEVYPFVSGDIDEVVAAWRQERLEQAAFTMPGCRRCRRRQGQCDGRQKP